MPAISNPTRYPVALFNIVAHFADKGGDAEALRFDFVEEKKLKHFRGMWYNFAKSLRASRRHESEAAVINGIAATREGMTLVFEWKDTSSLMQDINEQLARQTGGGGQRTGQRTGESTSAEERMLQKYRVGPGTSEQGIKHEEDDSVAALMRKEFMGE
jgi:hypothetical protein